MCLWHISYDNSTLRGILFYFLKDVYITYLFLTDKQGIFFRSKIYSGEMKIEWIFFSTVMLQTCKWHYDMFLNVCFLYVQNST